MPRCDWSPGQVLPGHVDGAAAALGHAPHPSSLLKPGVNIPRGYIRVTEGEKEEMVAFKMICVNFEVAFKTLESGTAPPYLVCLQPGPDVRVPGEGRHGDGGGAQPGQVVTVAAVQRELTAEPLVSSS